MNYLPIFVAVTSAAVVIQAGILIGMFLALRKTSSRMEMLATEVTSKVLPTAELAHNMLIELRPRVENIAANVSDSTTIVRAQMERLDSTVTELLDRARLQVIRTDELLGRAIDSVEATTESVQKTVSIPVRQFSGIMRGVSAGLEYLATKKRRTPAPQDEMFI
jgi:hypothetical protein